MNTMKRAMATAAFVLALGFAGEAVAQPVMFTVDPGATTPALRAGSFLITANNITLSDNATITFNNTGGFTEQGVFSFTAFNQGITAQANGGLSTPGGYGIYGVFSAAGQFNGLNYSITSLTFNLYGDPGYDTTFSADGLTVTDAGGTDFLLGTSGALRFGNATAVDNPGGGSDLLLFGAQIEFIPDPTQSAFYVAPNPFLLDIQASFTAIGLQIPTGIVIPGQTIITGGGGSASFLVPEPATLAMFGAGLFGLAAILRRRRDEQV